MSEGGRSEEATLAKYVLIGVGVTIVDLLLYPYLEKVVTPYAGPAGLLLCLIIGFTVGYVLGHYHGSGTTALCAVGSALGLAIGFEVGTRDPHLMIEILASVAGAMVSIAIGSLLG